MKARDKIDVVVTQTGIRDVRMVLDALQGTYTDHRQGMVAEKY